MPNSQALRTFICIDFPEEVTKEVARIQEFIEKQNPTGKITELENLHLTLKFLGEITPEALEKVKQALSKIKFPKLDLWISKAGTFNYGRRPKLVWIKVSGEAIFSLQNEIDKSLSDLFPKEERFMSHLTIARIKYIKDKQGFIKYVSRIKPKKIKFNIDKFKLKSSELHPGCPVYTTLEEYELE